ncbi:MAG: hypothetical protein M5U28_32895 [Sandaracinaceae bacterium]|nr:hypothetical protein [Sandaracinaceae bacterium]
MNEATTELYRREYRQELARHIRPLIRHAIRYWEMTLLTIERTGVRTEWADRARADLERMRGLLLEQEETAPAAEPSEPTSALPRLPGALVEGPALEPALEAARPADPPTRRGLLASLGAGPAAGRNP